MVKALVFAMILMFTASACNLDAATPEPLPTATSEPIVAPTNTAIGSNAGTTTLPTPTDLPRINEANNCTIPSGWVAYEVQPGDTLYGIGQLSGATVEDLVAGNCLENPDTIEVGQTLYIPGDNLPRAANPNAFYGLEIYLIVLNDSITGVPIGCGDSTIPQETQIRPTNDVETDLTAALTALTQLDTGIPATADRGIYNAIADQDLTLVDVSVDSGNALIRFDGNVQLVGVCGDARIEEQLLVNVFKYREIQTANINIGGKNMKQLFDASGLVGPDDVYTREEAPHY